MLDDARFDHIERALDTYPIVGVTTNPTIIKAAGLTSFYDDLQLISKTIGSDRSLHVQVVAQDTAGMLREAERILAVIGQETYIKVPVTVAGLAAIGQLKRDGINVTATAIYTSMQGLLAIAAGVDFLAPYVNRMANQDVDPFRVIAQLRTAIDRDASSAQIVAASFKNVRQVTDAVDAGAHAVTVTSDVLSSALAMTEVQHAVEVFAHDWETTFGTPSLP
ncbi:fructose-6-phosphate aldolase [Cellulomonas sp.]|uniref:fructose-6-phosphate aldolase n=1 Tax=Cellulomonas sp. TaxID=40001 RepID=UPI003BAB9255